MTNNIFEFVLELQRRFNLDIADTLAAFTHVAEALAPTYNDENEQLMDELL